MLASFLTSYLQAANGTSFVPAEREQLEILLDVYLLERAIAELGHELNNDTGRVMIPLRGILQLLGTERPATA